MKFAIYMAQLNCTVSSNYRSSLGSGGATPRSCRIFGIYRLENALKLMLNFKVKLYRMSVDHQCAAICPNSLSYQHLQFVCM